MQKTLTINPQFEDDISPNHFLYCQYKKKYLDGYRREM